LLSGSLQECLARDGPAEIIGESQQRTAMHNATLVQVPVIDVDFADEFVRPMNTSK
jgi:hypothetical protein